jgi:MFS family permease
MTSLITNQDQTTAKKPGFYYGYVIVICSFLILMVGFGTNYSFGIFFNPFLSDLGWSRAVTSSGYSLGIFLSGVLNIYGGRICDKIGPRKIVIICGIALALGCMLMSQLTQIWQFYIFYSILIGNGFGVPMIPLSSTISRWFIKFRGLMTGIVLAGIGTGIIVMPLLASGLLGAFKWRMSFFLIGIVVLIVTIPAALFLKRDPGKIGQQALGENENEKIKVGDREVGNTFREAVRTSRFWVLMILYTLFGFYVQGVLVHIVPYAKSIGIDNSSAVWILPCLGLGSIVGRVGMGNVSDRTGVKSALTIGLIVILSSFVWLWFANNLLMIYVFALWYGFGYGAMISMQTLAPARLFGVIAIGMMAGITVFVYTLGGTIGPIVTGYIYDVTGSYRLAIIIFGACAAGGLVSALVISKPKNKANYF